MNNSRRASPPDIGEHDTQSRTMAVAGGAGGKEHRATLLRDRLLSRALTVYAILWVVEGAFRKWVPGTESVFYILRDGLLVGALVAAAFLAPVSVRRHVGVAFWGVVFAIALIGFGQALVYNLPLAVPIIGIRNILSPLIPIYIVLRYRPRLVWRNIAIVVLAAAPAEAVLSIFQVLSPATAVINKQIGDEAASFTTAFGIVRASGSFSSPLGLTYYVAILLAMCAGALSRTGVRPALVHAGLLSGVIILAVSGSRGALLFAVIVAVGWAFSLLLSPLARRAAVGVLVTTSAAFLVASTAFAVVLRAFSVRLQTASDSNALDDRIAESAFGFLSYGASMFGEGLGVHGNAGIRLGSGAVWIEDENTRLVAELGIIGYAIIIGRFVLAILVLYLLVRHSLRKPPVLYTCGAILIYVLIVGGISTQPTTQGFFALVACVVVSAFYGGRLSEGVSPRVGRASKIQSKKRMIYP